MPGAARTDQESSPGAPGLVELLAIEHGAGTQDRLRDLGGHRPQGIQRHGRAQRDLEDGQSAFDQRPGQRHGVGRPLDGEDGDEGSAVGDGGNIHDQTLHPPSITFTVPVVKDASSLAR